MPYSIHDKLLCVERELRMRRRVYPRAVTDRRMTAEEAERENAAHTGLVVDPG